MCVSHDFFDQIVSTNLVSIWIEEYRDSHKESPDSQCLISSGSPRQMRGSATTILESRNSLGTEEIPTIMLGGT